MAQKDIYSVESSIRYASFLEQAGRFQEAAIEWERIAMLGAGNDSAFGNVIENYRRAEKPELGIRFYRSIRQKGKYSAEAFAKSMLTFAKPDSAAIAKELRAAGLSSNRVSVYSGISLGMNGKWTQSYELLSKLSVPENDGLPVGALALLMKEAAAKPDKKPWLAASMSAIVPGSGKFYTGDWTDGLMSLIFVGATAYQSYRGFNDKGLKSARGWIFGGLSLGFYTGNIYGSVVAAKKKNQKKKDAYRLKIFSLLSGNHS